MFSNLMYALVIATIANVRAQQCPPSSWEVTQKHCHYDELVKTLKEELSKDNCNPDIEGYLGDILGVETEREIKEEIAQICAEGGVPYQEMTGESHVFDKELYDGGTYYNEEREYKDEHGIVHERLNADPGNRIKQIYNEVARKESVSWPGYIDNFEDCKLRAAYCCFVQDRQAGDNNGNCATPYDENCVDANPGDNTDVCYVDMNRAPTSSYTSHGFALYQDNAEEATHCHGLAWAEDATDVSSRFKGNNLFYVSLYDHKTQRGYVKNVPGAPMCGCLEKMPVVTRADCTQVDIVREKTVFTYSNDDGLKADVDVEIKFNACRGARNQNNDLAAYYERLVNEGKATNKEKAIFDQTVIGKNNCPRAIDSFLLSQGFQKKPPLIEATYYAMAVNELPEDFDSLQPYKKDHVHDINFQQSNNFANSGRRSNVVIRFEGYLDFEEFGPGSYRLCITSDDGSKLYMGDEMLVDNDGLHGAEKKCAQYEVSEDVNLKRFVIEYFQRGGGATMTFSWQLPGSDDEVVIPKRAFVSARSEVPTASPTAIDDRSYIIRAQYYNFSERNLPPLGLSTLTPYKTSEVSTINFGMSNDFAGSGKASNIAIRFDGILKFKNSGEYELCITSDDGSKLFVDGDMLVDNDGLHGDVEKCEPYSVPKADTVKSVVIEFFQRGGGATMRFHWKVPNSQFKVLVPKSAWVVPANRPTLSPTKAAEREPYAIRAQYYNFFGRKLPPGGLSELESYKTSEITNINFRRSGNFAGSGKASNVAIRFDGILKFEKSGDYKLCITSDDGSKLFVDGILVVNNDGLHGDVEKCETFNVSSPDSKNIVIEFFQRGGGATMIFQWIVPGSRKTLIPENAWDRGGGAQGNNALEDKDMNDEGMRRNFRGQS